MLSPEFLQRLSLSPNDFDCLPRSHQVLCFAELLVEHGYSRFTSADISALFKTANMPSPRRGTPIRCSLKEVERHLDRWIQAGKLPLAVRDHGSYEVLSR